MAVGVLRPEIVVPGQAVQGLSLAHQESLLAHELAHVLRRDPAWRLVALLVERVLFFQPLNRLASRRVAQSPGRSKRSLPQAERIFFHIAPGLGGVAAVRRAARAHLTPRAGAPPAAGGPPP